MGGWDGGGEDGRVSVVELERRFPGWVWSRRNRRNRQSRQGADVWCARGQYSDAVLDELESQNDDEVIGITNKVKMLKNVATPCPRSDSDPNLYLHLQLTVAIGDEIRDSSKLADKMNDQFEGTRVRLRGTMNRMLKMAERTGVSWRVWLAFFAAIIVLFWYVWLF